MKFLVLLFVFLLSFSTYAKDCFHVLKFECGVSSKIVYLMKARTSSPGNYTCSRPSAVHNAGSTWISNNPTEYMSDYCGTTDISAFSIGFESFDYDQDSYEENGNDKYEELRMKAIMGEFNNAGFVLTNGSQMINLGLVP